LRRGLLEQFVLAAPKAVEEFLAVNRLHLSAFQVVVAAVERFAVSGKLIEVSFYDILHELVGGAASAQGGKVVEFLSVSGAKWTSTPSR
jgi:hypothetical protein